MEIQKLLLKKLKKEVLNQEGLIVKKYNLQLINQYMIGEQYMILYAIFTSF